MENLPNFPAQRLLNSLKTDYTREIDPLRALKLIEAMRWIKKGVELLEIENKFLGGVKSESKKA